MFGMFNKTDLEKEQEYLNQEKKQAADNTIAFLSKRKDKHASLVKERMLAYRKSLDKKAA